LRPQLKRDPLGGGRRIPGEHDYALSFAHIFMTVAAVLAAGFGIATAICAYLSQIRRRWLWILISLLGAPVTTMNWATGQVRTQALRIQVVNVGVVRPGPKAPSLSTKRLNVPARVGY